MLVTREPDVLKLSREGLARRLCLMRSLLPAGIDLGRTATLAPGMKTGYLSCSGESTSAVGR